MKMSDEERILKHFLLSSPPGQFDLILKDLESLSELSPDFVHQTRSEYNSRTGKEILQSTENLEFGNLQQDLGNYVDTYYKSKDVNSNYVIASNSEGGANVIIYAERIQLQQFHSGSWTARYSIEKDNDSLTISGKVVLHVHAFESGNLQLNSTTDFPSAKASMAGIVAQIQKWDEELMQNLDSIYENMSSDILKKLRRVMPVTRTRFDWNIAGHRGVRQLGMEVKKNKE